MLGEGDNYDGRPADTLRISVFLVLLLLFYSLSVFRFLLLLAIMKREGSCWSRFERDSPLLLVLGERCCLELGLWRRRVTDRVVWSLFFLLMVGDGSCGCPRC
uniref:Transmembrane protein n=1 Tax=Populus trichocarpa TaxID=3694 RepID=A0A2K1YM02_POPTR